MSSLGPDDYMLPKSQIEKYNEYRSHTDKSVLCHAPFVNLNFEQNGNITACCYNRKEVLGRYPQQSIADVWKGDAAENLRKHILQNDLRGGCSACGELLLAGNFGGSKAIFYDEYAPAVHNPITLLKNKFNRKIAPPKVFELELSNVCNLECGMCTGYFSSTIRKNREGLPPLPMPYDAVFVEQLKEFMPTLTDMKFLGGEPFLIDIYYDIWDEIIRTNPDIFVHITTNGSVLNQRGKNVLEKLKVGIVLSIDSLDPETYPKIRIGANYERVMQNLFYFKELTRSKSTYLTIAACPMTNNWKDLPQLLKFTVEQEINLHFNVVWTPEELSLKSFSIEQLDDVIVYLEENIGQNEPQHFTEKRNRQVYTDLVETLKYWRHEKWEKNKPETHSKKWITDFNTDEIYQPKDSIFSLIILGLLYFEEKNHQHYYRLKSLAERDTNENPENFTDLKSWFLHLRKQNDANLFVMDFLDVIQYLYNKTYPKETAKAFEKMLEIKSILNAAANTEQLSQELTETHPLSQVEYIHSNTLEIITQGLRARYA